MQQLNIFKHNKASGHAITQLYSSTKVFRVIGRSCNP